MRIVTHWPGLVEPIRRAGYEPVFVCAACQVPMERDHAAVWICPRCKVVQLVPQR